VVQADHKVCHMYGTKNDSHLHLFEQDTQPITFLISKQVVSYQTCGGTGCPGVSVTPSFKAKLNARSMCVHESGLHAYCIENGYRITNVSIYSIYYINNV
jgi:hypothetical protein